MTIVQEIKALQRFRSRPNQFKVNSPFIWPDFRSGNPEWHIIDYAAYVEEGFNLNALVYSAIMYKVRALMQVPLRAYTGEPERPELLPTDHPLQQLCLRPNPHQSFAEFQAQSMVYWNLAGNAYIMFARPEGGGQPEAMYSLRPDRVFIIPGTMKGTSGIKGFLYVPEGRSVWSHATQQTRRSMIKEDRAIPILPEDMMHIKLPNPSDTLEGMGYGLSPLSSAARTVDIDNKVTHFLKLFFDNGAMFQGLLKFDKPMQPQTVQVVKERWKEQYGGYTHWDEIGVLDQGGEFQRISPTFDEMGFEKIDARNESRSIMVFGVPPMLIGSRLGLARSTFSNYVEARQACWEDTLVPESQWWESDYQYYLQSEDGGFVRYDYSRVPALKEKQLTLVQSWADLVDRGVPKNIAADVVGLPLPQLADGQVIYMPFNLIPMGGSSSVTETEVPEANDNIEAESDERTDDKGLKKGVSKEHIWKRVDRIATNWERKFKQVGKEQFQLDLDALLEIMKENKSTKAIDWQTVYKKWQWYLEQAGVRWREAFIPVIEGVMTEQGEQWVLQFGVEFDIRSLFAEDWFSNYMSDFAQPILDTTRRDISALYRQAMQEGLSIPDMDKRLKLLFKTWVKDKLTDAEREQFGEWFTQRLTPHRLEMLSRTETMKASNSGSFHLFEAWNVRGGSKMWLATFDHRIRKWHEAAGLEYDEDGAIPLDEPFIVNGEQMMYPHDTANASPDNYVSCRCSFALLLPEWT